MPSAETQKTSLKNRGPFNLGVGGYDPPCSSSSVCWRERNIAGGGLGLGSVGVGVGVQVDGEGMENGKGNGKMSDGQGKGTGATATSVVAKAQDCNDIDVDADAGTGANDVSASDFASLPPQLQLHVSNPTTLSPTSHPPRLASPSPSLAPQPSSLAFAPVPVQHPQEKHKRNKRKL
ncbi:hypothetical protein H0H92_007538, partial [Tricholoma furcatifolium]